jgi:hypothetical protein
VKKYDAYRRLAVFALILVASTVLFVFAGGSQNEPLTESNKKIREVIAVQEEVTSELMSRDDILGTAVGEDDDGEIGIIVYVNLHGRKLAETIGALPKDLKGKRVMVEITEPFYAMAKNTGVATATISHTAIQTAPIQLGTSGGWKLDTANGYCCGGTLGSLIIVNGIQYILSNYHVFESDVVLGGNSTVARDGDPVIQPGLIDVSCGRLASLNVGTLKRLSSLPTSNVDASIAQTSSGMVNPYGAILEIGTISKSTVAARMNQAVKKSGRTTGLTRSKVSGLNATISVTYSNECAGGTAFTKTFTGQIVVGNKGSQFLNSGDSGSLMVEDVTTTPRAIGLLFAGSSSLAIANPINEVLAFVGSSLGGTATMVGQ